MDILFYRHQTAGQRKRGLCAIYHRITINGNRAELYSTHLNCRYDDFDPDRQRLKPADKDYLHKNGRLNDIEGELLDIYTTLSRRKKPFTPQAVKEMYMSDVDEIRFMDTFDKYLEEVAENPDRTKSTKKAYKNVRNKVLEFLITKKKQKEILENFDMDMLMQYRNWLRNHEKFEDSTMRKHLATIKQVHTWAKLNKLSTQNPLAGFRIPHEKRKPNVCLSVAQFELLKSHQFSTDRLQRVADVFVVYCRTGFHYDDLRQMAKAGESTIQQIAEFNFIKWNRGKTDLMAKVPSDAWPELNQIVRKYGGWDKLPILSNQKTNDYLKLVAAELNVAIMQMSSEERKLKNLVYLPEKLTVKAGRKTLADWLLNELCWSKEAVKVVLGLATDKSLDSYVREDERRVLRELRRGNDSQQSA